MIHWKTDACLMPPPLQVTKNSQVPFLKSSSYIRTALRLASAPLPLLLARGIVQTLPACHNPAA